MCMKYLYIVFGLGILVFNFPPPTYKRHKRMEKCAYEVWKSSVLASNDQRKAKVPDKRMKQARLNFAKNAPKKVVLEAS
ncbi:origin of replication complex subunit 6 [Cinnamomum micranthum f. kanehirae]|uniref:Origin of replication complex subunit 6 n=1 Tax=Cinnamomum micranthum f. kanehirae TaxID=337451 RepID=A0A3S3PHV9_9MAGN|nr:origin of replication complex subunit 6 [Cinnamomum micranthum f. kanehirae]